MMTKEKWINGVGIKAYPTSELEVGQTEHASAVGLVQPYDERFYEKATSG